MRIIIKSELRDACKYVQYVIDKCNYGEGTITIFRDGVYVSVDKSKTGYIFYVWKVKS